MEDDERPPVRLERPERPVELVAIDDAAAEVGGRRRVERGQLDLMGPALAASDEIETGVDEQSMKPGIEPVRVAQRGQVPPGSDEGLLDRVSGELVVAEDEARSRVQARDGRAGERRKGVMIAPLRSFDETSLVHGRLGYVRGRCGRAQ